LTWIKFLFRFTVQLRYNPKRYLTNEQKATNGKDWAHTKEGALLMAIHKQILEWQAAHPNITWIGWGIVWAIVLTILFWPRAGWGIEAVACAQLP
jgi:hypothetical protein